ncbi:hypothetical protein BX600DRAFT_550951 [Xylariales sp. PMI_506]|nr:hypothetical protein BX600DRAFT_550951 [Xylariales sp. PMI_506]
MFRRLWVNLPEDPRFPSDLEQLGYFVNGSDEIRSIKNPDYYFKYFLSRNERYNVRQRFAMNEAIEILVHSRLRDLDLEKIYLPLGASNCEPHVPVFVSGGLQKKSRVCIIFGERFQDLGILAHRVIGGRGGVDKGSLCGIVKTLRQQSASLDDASPPGIILANTGQSYWSPELGRPLTRIGMEGAPRPSAVHGSPLEDDEKNRVRGNRNCLEHICYIFEELLPAYAHDEARIDILAIGDAAEALEQYLDNSSMWPILVERMNCLIIIGGYLPVDDLQRDGLKQFLREKARAYAISHEPVGRLLSGPDGNLATTIFTHLGCPVYSGGESCFIETLLVACADHALSWMQEVANAEEHGAGYNNPIIDKVEFADPVDDAAFQEPDWSEWQKAHQHHQKTSATVEAADFGAETEIGIGSQNDGASKGIEDKDYRGASGWSPEDELKLCRFLLGR